MPIGVEHYARQRVPYMGDYVPVPVMPIGVEHMSTWASRSLIACALPRDANRR